MKIVEFITNVIGKIWKFAKSTFFLCLLSSVILLVFTIIMPENALKAVDIIKNIFILA